MPKGGLMQIISYGNQDKILMENPQITFFKCVYRKPTLFSIENTEKTINLSNTSNNDNSLTTNVTIPNHGDLLKSLDIKFELPSIQFDYKEQFIDIVKKQINDKTYSGNVEAFYYNISKLELLELILYNYIVYATRLETTSDTLKYTIIDEINSINKSLNGTIILEPQKFDLIYNEIELEELLSNDDNNQAVNLNSVNYIADNTVLNNVINQQNASNLLSSDEINNLNNNFDTSLITSLNDPSLYNIVNYGIQYLINLKLQIIDIMMQNYDTYISLFNIIKYFENNLKNQLVSDEKQIYQYNDLFYDFIKNMTYRIIKSDEVYSYHSIINSPPSDIKSLVIDNYNNYVLNVQEIYYDYPLMIVVGNEYSSLDKLIIKNILQVTKITYQSSNTSLSTNNKIMLINSVLFKNDYNSINTSCFISCSNTPDSLINYSEYIPIHKFNITYTPFTSQNNTFSDLNELIINDNNYYFQVKGDYKSIFTIYKLCYIFSSKISTSSYDYLYNDLNNNKFYTPIAIFSVFGSSYDSITKITTIAVTKLTFTQTVASGDNIFIKNNVVLPIKNITITSINTDVVLNYNSYIKSSETDGLSNNNILLNLQNILNGTIKYNTGYLTNLYNSVFNYINYFFHIIETQYSTTTETFSYNASYKNTYLQVILPFLLNIIIDPTIEGNFLYRSSDDTTYNNYYNRIKSILYTMIGDYNSIMFNYNFKLSNYSNNVITYMFQAIANLTTDFNLDTGKNPQGVSNIYLNNSIGLGDEFCLLKSDIQLLPGDLLDITTNQYTLNYYTNDNYDVTTIQYNKLDILRNINFNKITYFLVRNGIIFIVDNYDQIYIINNNSYKSIFYEKNVTNLQLKYFNVPWSPIILSYNSSFYNITSSNLFHKKYFIDKVNNNNNNIFYNTELNTSVQLEQTIFFKPVNICNIENKYKTKAVIPTTNDNKLYFVSGILFEYRYTSFININALNDSNNLNIKLNSSAISKTINYNSVSNIIYYSYFNGLATEYFIITIDISNNCIYIYSENTAQTDIINISFLIYGLNPNIHNINYYNSNNIKLINANISNNYLYLYVQNTDDLTNNFIVFNLQIYYNQTTNMIDSQLQLYSNGFIGINPNIQIKDLPKQILFLQLDPSPIPSGHTIEEYLFYVYIYNSRIYYYNLVNNTSPYYLSNTVQFNDTIKFVVWNKNYIVIYLNNINTIQIYKINEFLNNNLTNVLTINNLENDNDWLINEIQCLCIDNYSSYGNLFIGSNNNIYKIMLSNSGSSINYKYINTTVIDPSYGIITNIATGNTNNILYILTSLQFLKYNYSTYVITQNVIPNIWYYSYYDAEIIFNNYYNTVSIIDKQKNRIINATYKLEYDLLVFDNPNSSNLVSINGNSINKIRYVQNKLNGSDYSQTILVLLDTYCVPLIYSNQLYTSLQPFLISFNQNIIIIDVIYNKDTLIFLNYNNLTNVLYLYKLSNTLDNIIYEQINNNNYINTTSLKYTINGLTYVSSNIYNVLSDDNYEYILMGQNNKFNQYKRLTINLLNNTQLDVEPFIGNGLTNNYNYTIPTYCKNVYFNNITNIDVLPTDDIILNNDSKLYYINNENIIKLNMDFGYTGPTITAGTYGNTGAWYVPPNDQAVIQQHYNVVSQTNYKNNLYFLTTPVSGSTGPTGSTKYIVNYIDTYTLNTLNYNKYYSIIDPNIDSLTGQIKIYTMACIGLNDWIVLTNGSNVYLYKLNTAKTAFELKNTIPLGTSGININSIMFSKINFISDVYVPKFDSAFHYLMYVLPQNDITYDNTTYTNINTIKIYLLHPDGFCSVFKNTYIKPYYISSNLTNDATSTITTKYPDINHPYLFYIDNIENGSQTIGPTGSVNISPLYSEYLLGNEKSQIVIVELGPTGTSGIPYVQGYNGLIATLIPPYSPYLYEIAYQYVKGPTLNFPKYINDIITQSRSVVGTSIKISCKNNQNYNLKLLFKYENIKSITNPTKILCQKKTWENNYMKDTYYNRFNTSVENYNIIYMDNSNVILKIEYYFTEQIKKRYTYNQHDIQNIRAEDSLAALTFDDNNITYEQAIYYDYRENFTIQDNVIVNLDNKDYTYGPFKSIQTAYGYNVVNNYINTPKINGIVTLITRDKYINTQILKSYFDTFMTQRYYYNRDTTSLYIFYKITDTINITTYPTLSPYGDSWNFSEFIYIKYNEKYYIGHYAVNNNTIGSVPAGTKYLVIYYKIQGLFNFYDINDLTSLFYPSLGLYDLFQVPYNSLTTFQKSPKPTTFYNIPPNVPSNFYNVNVIILDYINTIANMFNTSNGSGANYDNTVIYDNYQYQVYEIINNILLSTANLISYNDNTIIGTDPNKIIYEKIQFNNTAGSFYLKMSNNFDNFVGYKSINNKIVTSINRKSILDYYNSINILFKNYNDYIIKQLKIIADRPNTADFLTWIDIETVNIENTIQYIYTYLKYMISLSVSANNYTDFTQQTINDSVYYLMKNIFNFQNIYDEVSVNYFLTDWNIIRKCIFDLYYGISNINNILNNNTILVNNVNTYLKSINYISPTQTPSFSQNIIYLENQTDATILTYMEQVINSIFNNYILNDVLKTQQQIMDMYLKYFSQLFNNSDIGSTINSTINNISLLYDLDVNYINLNIYTVPNNNYNPFILPYSYNIYNIDYIKSYLNSQTLDFNQQLIYYTNNVNILNLSKLKPDDVYNKYIEYFDNKKPITCLAINPSTNPNNYILNISAIYDIKINDYVGFYSASGTYNLYKVLAISYMTNSNYSNINNLPQTVTNYPVYVPINITIESPIIPTMNFTSPNNIIYYGINALRLNNYTPSLLSSIDLRNTICYIIFNNFNTFDNIYYDVYLDEYNYWYLYDPNNNNQLTYFTSYPPKQTNRSELFFYRSYADGYSTFILNNLKSTYKITDINLLKDVFTQVFSEQVELYTIDNIIYKFSQIINSNKKDNSYYSFVYLIYTMYHFINNNNIMFNSLIDINNIENVINTLNSQNIDDINSILKLASNTTDSKLYKYNIFTINNYPLDNISSINTTNMVLSNDLIHSFVYPYNNFNTTLNFNIDSALRNKCITIKLKFDDINNIISNITKYYTSSTYEIQSLVDIMFFDRFTKDIAINKIKSITLLNNSGKFDLYNGILKTDPYLTTNININSVNYIFDNNTVNVSSNYLFYNNVVIDSVEKINYFRLKMQQMFVWYLGTIIDPNNDLHYKYYHVLPENMMYNYDTDNIATLTSTQYTTINKFIEVTSMNTTNIVNMIDNITSSYYSSSNISNINSIITSINTINNVTNLVTPCYYYYIAYIITKLINRVDLKLGNKYFYINDPFKCNYNNYVKNNYTQKQLDFLTTQSKSTSFFMEDWIGEIDGIQKIFLCNHILLFNYINDINNYTLNNNNFVTILSHISNIGSDIYIINYLLMIVLNNNGNHIESHYNTSATPNVTIDLLMKYPTLYLLNGRLVRTTNMPNYYYYDVNTFGLSNYLTIKKIKLDNTNRIIYNVVQSNIGKTLNYINTQINGYYDVKSQDNDFIEMKKYDINIATDVPALVINNSINNYMKYNYNISISGSVLTVSTSINHPIIINTYVCITDNINPSKYYYCFISTVDTTTITINQNLSDDISNISSGILYGGLNNMITRVYESRDNQYISANNILDRYNEYDNLSQKIINYMGTYFGNRYEGLNNNNFLISDTYFFTTLITMIINDHKTINIDNNSELSNYILPTDILSLNQTLNLDINDALILYSSITSKLNQNKKEYDNIIIENNNGNTNSPPMYYILNASSGIYNIYNPKPATGNWIKYLGHYILDYIEFYIGDELIHKITDDYLQINYGLTISEGKRDKYLYNIGYTKNMLTPNNSIKGQMIYLFIPWFFNKSTHSLPLISLINTKSSIKLKMKELDKLVIHDDFIKVIILDKNNRPSTISNIKTTLLMDHIYLDTDERKKFISLRHEYLIEQLQYISPMYVNKMDILNGSVQLNINFNNCVKDMFWFCITGSNLDAKDYSNYTSSASYYNKILSKMENILLYGDNLEIKKIIDTGYNRILKQMGNNNVDIKNINTSWFNKNELDSYKKILEKIEEYDINIPITGNTLLINGKILLDRDNKYTTTVIQHQKYNNNNINGLNVYSFSLHPMDGQPSGSLNFSAINKNDIKLKVSLDTTLNVTENKMLIKVIGRSYNILRIFSGLGACVYN